MVGLAVILHVPKSTVLAPDHSAVAAQTETDLCPVLTGLVGCKTLIIAAVNMCYIGQPCRWKLLISSEILTPQYQLGHKRGLAVTHARLCFLFKSFMQNYLCYNSKKTGLRLVWFSFWVHYFLHSTVIKLFMKGRGTILAFIWKDCDKEWLCQQ